MGEQRVAVVFAHGVGALWSPNLQVVAAEAEIVRRVSVLEARGPRWVWWSAAEGAGPLVRSGLRLARCWDVAEAHRLTEGGWAADPGRCWAAARGLPLDSLPGAPTGDLFEAASEQAAPEDDLENADGHLRAEAGRGDWLRGPTRLLRWAEAAYDTAHRQQTRLEALGPRAVATACSESAAALLCQELERDGLPVDRTTAEELIAAAAGPRTHAESDAAATRRARDLRVLQLVPGHDGTDLRNPRQVRDMLASVGVVVPTTRKWVLEPYRETHPVVEALLEWRKAERIATTYGYAWLDAHVGADERLRGGWTACDGGAGRMTAQHGLHNLPAALRPAVAARPGHVLVRADLGQIEPRVLAAVSGDECLAAATHPDDFYAPVAAVLGVERPAAKVAVLAAMYGQRTGTAGAALQGLQRAYPVAMAFLDRAYDVGVEGGSLRTYGGRLVRSGESLSSHEPAIRGAHEAARGRFVRNAVIQGSAAELFKAWAATVRATTAELDARIVLCLHDELLLHVRAEHGAEVCRRLGQALEDSTRRWTGSGAVRFVADTAVVGRWSEAKG